MKLSANLLVWLLQRTAIGAFWGTVVVVALSGRI